MSGGIYGSGISGLGSLGAFTVAVSCDVYVLVLSYLVHLSTELHLEALSLNQSAEPPAAHHNLQSIKRADVTVKSYPNPRGTYYIGYQSPQGPI